MKVRIEYTETSVRYVDVEVESLDAAKALWAEAGDEAHDWIDKSIEHDGGVDWLSAEFMVMG